MIGRVGGDFVLHENKFKSNQEKSSYLKCKSSKTEMSIHEP